MTQKIAVVTGANAGLGFAITQELARRDYQVVMACRNLQKAEDAKSRLLEQAPNADLRVLALDLSEPASIETFVQQFADDFGQLDLLINNAGILGIPLTRNSVGQEMQMATNYLGNFILVGKMLPCFRTEEQARIVNVGSLSNRFGKLMLDDLNWETTPYKDMKGYANSKVALMTFTIELDRRLKRSGKNIIALSGHPGFANTDITRKSPLEQSKSAFKKWREKLMEPLIPLPEDAARPIVHAACAEDVKGGDYYGPGGLMEIAGKPAKAKINKLALDPENGRRLWELSQMMTGVYYLDD